MCGHSWESAKWARGAQGHSVAEGRAYSSLPPDRPSLCSACLLMHARLYAECQRTTALCRYKRPYRDGSPPAGPRRRRDGKGECVFGWQIGSVESSDSWAGSGRDAHACHVPWPARCNATAHQGGDGRARERAGTLLVPPATDSTGGGSMAHPRFAQACLCAGMVDGSPLRRCQRSHRGGKLAPGLWCRSGVATQCEMASANCILSGCCNCIEQVGGRCCTEPAQCNAQRSVALRTYLLDA